MAEKIFILDTNVLIHDPEALFKFPGAQIGIPAIVLEELDTFKRETTDRARNAREIIRHFDTIRHRGSLRDGVELDNGSMLRVLFLDANLIQKFPFRMPIDDNEILLTAYVYKNQGYDVKFISKDLNARVKADALGIEAQDYLKGRITKDHFYHGWQRLQVPALSLKKGIPTELEEFGQNQPLEINEYVLVESRNNPNNYRVFRHLGKNTFRSIEVPRLQWPLTPRNPQQLMAFDLLLDDDIQLVSLFGPAGTGKTFMALLAGTHKVIIEDRYERLLVARPIVPLGKDIGYIPGDVHEKLYNWMLPVYDNMDFIAHSTSLTDSYDAGKEEQYYNKKDKRNKHMKRERFERKNIQSLDDLIHRGKVSLEAITYMRGRSIPYQYIFIDEVQNLTLHEVKTLVSRVGEGSKIILAGDPYQIDAPYLDFTSNGLVVATEKMKGQDIFGTIYLETSERSKLSQLVTDLL